MFYMIADCPPDTASPPQSHSVNAPTDLKGLLRLTNSAPCQFQAWVLKIPNVNRKTISNGKKINR